jgi:hypothetical protein
MQRGRFVALVLMAALLLVGYRVFFTDQAVPVQPWYVGQDITEGDDPIPFNAQSGSGANYPERDDYDALPSDVYRYYIDSARRNYFDLSLLTAASQAMFVDRKPSQEQLRNSVAGYEECRHSEEVGEGELAVIRFPPAQRLCDPVFFKLEQGLWKIDFATMRDELGHNHQNFWYFRQGVPATIYGFAFAGWEFDSKGFPLTH